MWKHNYSFFFEGQSADATNGDSHNFTSGEIKDLQKSLLSWYDEKKRTLPWRTIVGSSITCYNVKETPSGRRVESYITLQGIIYPTKDTAMQIELA